MAPSRCVLLAAIPSLFLKPGGMQQPFNQLLASFSCVQNKAYKAEDAFKAVSRAFSCLSDTQKRAYYDRTGYESSGAAQQARAQRGGGGRNMYYAGKST